ncbi:1-deoxy-D-xylulose-5-phosphate reductoisomerase [Boudabousia marimammalium]|uniref:1-deoxy-D-xylulose 5-phosphate reductoisomerase n=1 Tax=Boudabousia marimammalium TaxID=156892 RepID=A0A1Q5PNT6_9ACTO|nr:1-deoxy-D-xylulose-5-phosphate reductoisomerase [Boudabousia marimammalium]OKL49216.1 1-deoxy-D-xylulose-5-phosphate reductoisomerase [Boudabousia marimammalium]
MSSSQRPVVILGSTGSIGTQCIRVIERNPNLYRVTALAAGGHNLALLARQCVRLGVEIVAIADGDKAELEAELRQAFQTEGLPVRRLQILVGERAATECAASSSADTVVVNGITGAIGLDPSLAALRAGATLALANKESLVAGAPLIRSALQRPGQIVPVDSEHSAIAQCLRSGRHERGLTVPVVSGKTDVSSLVLTASGGPFRGKTRAELETVTVAQALNHPTWDMGPVVTINSATLMNKALELIEAHVLFDIAPEHIIPVVHPQSHIHSMVQWKDGSTIAQTSPPSMLIPIALGLSWPDRLEAVAPANLFDFPFSWDFEPVDLQTFPALQLARECAAAGGTMPAVMNAANEVCVQAFRDERIGFLDIVARVQEVCSEHETLPGTSHEEVSTAVTWAQSYARHLIATR